MKRALLLLALAPALAACPPSAPAATVVQVHGNIGDASVTIDDHYVGALAFVASKKGVILPQGKHRITVEKAGYFPVDKIIETTTDAPVKVDIVLTKVPD